PERGAAHLPEARSVVRVQGADPRGPALALRVGDEGRALRGHAVHPPDVRRLVPEGRAPEAERDLRPEGRGPDPAGRLPEELAAGHDREVPRVRGGVPGRGAGTRV